MPTLVNFRAPDDIYEMLLEAAEARYNGSKTMVVLAALKFFFENDVNSDSRLDLIEEKVDQLTGELLLIKSAVETILRQPEATVKN